jgi:hypothetical protein
MPDRGRGTILGVTRHPAREDEVNAQQARRRREAAVARQTARRRQRRRWLGIAALLAIVLVAGAGGLAVRAAHRDRPSATSPVPLAGHPGVPTPPVWPDACRPSAWPR